MFSPRSLQGGYFRLVSITGSSSNNWFELIWLPQRRQIKWIQAVFYRTCPGTRTLILTNQFLLSPLRARPLLIVICWCLTQGCELTSSLFNFVWELGLLIFPEYACIMPPSFSSQLKYQALSKPRTSHSYSHKNWDWIFVWVVRELSNAMDLDAETHLLSEKDKRMG